MTERNTKGKVDALQYIAPTIKLQFCFVYKPIYWFSGLCNKNAFI